MSINSRIEDFEQLIHGLKIYQNCLQDSCHMLSMSVQLYDEGMNDRTSKVFRKKITKLCDRIDPFLIERVECLVKNLIAQKEQLEEMEAIISMDDDNNSDTRNIFRTSQDRRNDFLERIKTNPIYTLSNGSNNNSEDDTKGERVRAITREVD